MKISIAYCGKQPERLWPGIFRLNYIFTRELLACSRYTGVNYSRDLSFFLSFLLFPFHPILSFHRHRWLNTSTNEMNGRKDQKEKVKRRTPNLNFTSNDHLDSMRLTQKFAENGISPLLVASMDLSKVRFCLIKQQSMVWHSTIAFRCEKLRGE